MVFKGILKNRKTPITHFSNTIKKFFLDFTGRTDLFIFCVGFRALVGFYLFHLQTFRTVKTHCPYFSLLIEYLNTNFSFTREKPPSSRIQNRNPENRLPKRGTAAHGQSLFRQVLRAVGKERTVTNVLGREQTLGGPIAFAFIDGTHDYDFARRDFENVDKFLAKGGYVLFDDSGKNSQWRVARLMKEIPYEFIDANPNYLFRKV